MAEPAGTGSGLGPGPGGPPRPPCLEAALAYLARGWTVLPVMPGDKRPLVPWQSLQHHRPSPREVVRWFRRWPRANVGIVTGRISGLVVLDVDPAHGGEASLARLEEAHGPLPETVACRTGGGGRHLYFAHPGGVVRNRAGLAQGLDLRGDGGYVVAPPSVHLSGARYAWESGRSPWEQELAPLPEWLRQRAAGRRGHPVAYWRALVREGVEEGARNSTLASLTGHLLWHGVDPYVALELLLAWNRVRCRPPLPDEEVAKVVASIARLHEREEQEGREGAGGEGG